MGAAVLIRGTIMAEVTPVQEVVKYSLVLSIEEAVALRKCLVNTSHIGRVERGNTVKESHTIANICMLLSSIRLPDKS